MRESVFEEWLFEKPCDYSDGLPGFDIVEGSAHAVSRVPCGQVAQLVEHTTENRSVDSSILSLATTLRSLDL